MSNTILSLLVVFTTVISCSSNEKETDLSVNNDIQTVVEKKAHNEDTLNETTSPNEKITKGFILNGRDTLLQVDYYNSNIYWDLKYSTKDNFMKRVLYDTLDRVYLQASVVRRLTKVQEKLTAINKDYHLLVYDGVRPLSVQWEMWNALDTIPVAERGRFVSNPANGSVHNYGAAVDITICKENRTVLDMGAGYDDIRKIAYPSLEKQFLASGELTKEHISNRQLLRNVMSSQSFANIPSEWWHFNAFSRPISKSKFGIVKNEIISK